MFQYLFVIYPHTFFFSEKNETRYPEIAINNCSDGTFSFLDDWPLIYNQVIHFFYLLYFITKITKSKLPNQMTAFKGMNGMLPKSAFNPIVLMYHRKLFEMKRIK